MKKLLKSKKALSPVVASTVLISVTVAVSIAVAAWMGSLTRGFTEEQLTIVSLDFHKTTNVITVNYQNIGTADITITDVMVTGGNVTAASLDEKTCGKGTSGSIEVSIDTGALVSGTSYNVKILSSEGNAFQHTATA